MSGDLSLLRIAPCGNPQEYDRRHLALYAALLDAESSGQFWQDVVATVMQLNPNDEGAQRCWESHLERARWIVGDGLAYAVEAFGKPDSGETD
jgi:hypothetical protein